VGEDQWPTSGLYKNGVSTGLTKENLVKITREYYGHNQLLPNSPSSSPSLSDSGFSDAVEQDETKAFYMTILWTNPESPFASPGDSGSLVFTVFTNKSVPLGIHASSDGNTSTAYLLYSWFEEVEHIPTGL
jgi:hypothetical protein